MIKKYISWKAKQRNGKRWLLSFAENFLFWGFGYGIFECLDFFELAEPWSIKEYLFKTTFMAFFWTLTTDWKETKALFGKIKY